MKTLIILSSALFLTGCFDSDEVQDSNQEDLNTNTQIEKNLSSNAGQVVFEKNCISCHGKEGQGLVENWKQRQADGKFPAPPVNGTAHAWHHSPAALMNTINNGGIKLGGWMPGFKDQLSEDEKKAVLDYIHDLWPAELQEKYDSRFK
ncbi:MAG: cytochrome c [Candidatus Thioglobus sp.]|nr:cytochrome c [Candidatus Thioglobus pontius]MBL6976988.1 cytochrome c [Candidatus Thioglobus sp.]MBL6984764.1 cytochrome c [Candidatus Thioglobus sp.]